MLIGGRSIGDATGDLLILAGTVVFAGGLWFLIRAYNDWQNAYDNRSRSMMAYPVVLSSVVTLAGIVLFSWGINHVRSWLDSFHTDTLWHKLRYHGGGLDLTILGLQLRYSFWEYHRAFEASGMISLVIVGLCVLGLYITYLLLGYIGRRKIDPVDTTMLVGGILLGPVLAVSTIFGLYQWLNYVAGKI